MGWSQPVQAGKRVHSSTQENSSSNSSEMKTGDGEELSDPPPYYKRPREVSPELESICNSSSLVSDQLAFCSEEVPGNEASSSCDNGKDICLLKLGKLTPENPTQHPATEKVSNGITDSSSNGNGISSSLETSENGSGSDSDITIRTSSLRNPNDSSLNSNGNVSQKGIRISQTRKGPRVLASRRLSSRSNTHKKNGVLKRSSTAQSITAPPPVEDEDEDSDESEVFLDDNVQSARSESSTSDNSLASSASSSSGSGNLSASGSSVDNVPKSEVKRIIPAIRPSYFPFVPPYINFCMHDEKTDELPEEIKKLMKWRLSPITPIVVKRTVSNSGYRLLRKTVEWEGQWGKHMKSTQFRGSLKDFQKLNHIPGTFQVGRKDRLWRNLHRFITKFGKEEFGFLPRTFILPQEMKQLKAAWDSAEGKNTPWIVKPPAAARGTGIRVVNKWNQVPKKKPVIVQAYVANPYLINDRKFDLRLYVLVTDFNPLKIYMYNDGLVRFAPVKYSHDSKRVGDRFMHLTNYSVNKNCELYTHNEDAEKCEGHKWTLKTLWRYLKDRNVDTELLWDRMEEIVVKTLLSAEELISSNSHCMPNRYSGYELFGFDIIIDQDLKPWLLEVNISPSLHSSSPLDLAVKGPLIKEVFNIVGFHLPMKLSVRGKKKFLQSLDVQLELETPVFDKRLYATVLNKDEKLKHRTFRPHFLSRDKYLKQIIETLTPDDVRQLIIAEDELSQCEGFTRIFPGPNTYTYFPYFENPRYYNMLFDAWEARYGGNRIEGVERLIRLCHNKVHLDVEPSALNATSGSQVNEEPAGAGDAVAACSSGADLSDKVENEATDEIRPMDVEENGVDVDGDILITEETPSSESSSLTNSCSTSTTDNSSAPQFPSQSSAPAPPSCQTTPAEGTTATVVMSAPPPPPAPTAIPLVLDNITNSPRSIIQDVFSNSPTIKCHDEDRLSVGNPNSQMQQPVGDYIKGICF